MHKGSFEFPIRGTPAADRQRGADGAHYFRHMAPAPGGSVRQRTGGGRHRTKGAAPGTGEPGGGSVVGTDCAE